MLPNSFLPSCRSCDTNTHTQRESQEYNRRAGQVVTQQCFWFPGNSFVYEVSAEQESLNVFKMAERVKSTESLLLRHKLHN